MKKSLPSLLLLLACVGTAEADVITEWNALMRETFKSEGSTATPPTNSRTMGMLGGAMFDAVNSVNRSYSSYLGYFDPTTAGSSIDVNAAAAAAANTVLQSVYADYYGGSNSYAANFTSLYNTQISGIADGERLEIVRHAAGLSCGLGFVGYRQRGTHRKRDQHSEWSLHKYA